MQYSLNPIEVKKVIDAVAKGLPYDYNQFMYYHLNRNHFNVGNEVTSLTEMTGGRFLDNAGNAWTEVSTLKNFFHMP